MSIALTTVLLGAYKSLPQWQAWSSLMKRPNRCSCLRIWLASTLRDTTEGRASVPRPKNEKFGHVYFLEYQATPGDGAYETVGRGSAQLITYTIA